MLPASKKGAVALGDGEEDPEEGGSPSGKQAGEAVGLEVSSGWEYGSGPGTTPLFSFLISVKENSSVCFQAIAKLVWKGTT